jgi:hypothetical protein
MAKKRTHAVVGDMYTFGGVYLTYVLAVGTESECKATADTLINDLVYRNVEVVETCQGLLSDWDKSDEVILYYDYEDEEEEAA